MPQPARSADAPVAVVNNAPGLLRALQERRESIADQYQSTMAERGRVGQERLNAQARGDAALVREYDATMDRLGARLKSLEATLARADQQLDEAMQAPVAIGAAAPASEAVVAVAPRGPDATQVLREDLQELESIMTVGGIGLAGLAILAWRFGLARGKRQALAELRAKTELPRDDDRLQQAVDAIAIEVERLSEGQRFLNNLMASRRAERDALPRAPLVSTPSDGTRITPH